MMTAQLNKLKLNQDIERLIDEYSIADVLVAIGSVMQNRQFDYEKNANSALVCALDAALPVLVNELPRMGKRKKKFVERMLGAPIIRDAIEAIRQINRSGKLSPHLQKAMDDFEKNQ